MATVFREELRLEPQDERLFPIVEKVLDGERLTAPDAVALFETRDLLTVGALADRANRNKNGDRVFFVANQHINPTNVCVLRANCVFCSFARRPLEDGAYTMPLEEVFEEASAIKDTPIREFHIVGGLHPKLRLEYYEDMIRGLKDRHPGVEVKALTAVEIAHLARIEKTDSAEVLSRLQAAGLDTMPGVGLRCSRRACVPPSRIGSWRPTSGSTCTGRHTGWGSAPTAPCSTGTWRRCRTAWTICSCCGTCRTRRAGS